MKGLLIPTSKPACLQAFLYAKHGIIAKKEIRECLNELGVLVELPVYYRPFKADQHFHQAININLFG